MGGGVVHGLYQFGSNSLASSAAVAASPLPSSGDIQNSQSTILSAAASQYSSIDEQQKTMENIPEEPERKVDMHQIRIKAWKLCRNYLTGVWKQVKAEDLHLEEIW